MSREVVRKVRSDKKRDVKPTINEDLKDAIYRLSYITQTPVKNVCEQLVQYTLNDRDIIGELSLKFRRDVRMGNTLFVGHKTVVPIPKRDNCISSRITLRLVEHDYELLTRLAYALDCRPTRVCAILLDAGMRDFRFVNNYVKRYLHGHLSDAHIKELREIVRYMNGMNKEYHTLASLLGLIIDEVSAPVTRIRDAVSEFLGTIKDK